MKTLFEFEDRESLTMEVEAGQGLESLKKRIERHSGIPIEQQLLFMSDGRQVNSLDMILKPSIYVTVRSLLKPGRPFAAPKQVFAKLFGGSTIAVDFDPHHTTVEDLKTSISKAQGLCSADYRLMFMGRCLEADSSTRLLRSYQIAHESTVDLVLPLKGGAPKTKCFKPDCMEAAVKIIGVCRYCSHTFCGKHRLPETHACTNIQGCRDNSFQKNESKLLKEKCVADKV